MILAEKPKRWKQNWCNLMRSVLKLSRFASLGYTFKSDFVANDAKYAQKSDETPNIP